MPLNARYIERIHIKMAIIKIKIFIGVFKLV
jgi:hypothetical protein